MRRPIVSFILALIVGLGCVALTPTAVTVAEDFATNLARLWRNDTPQLQPSSRAEDAP